MEFFQQHPPLVSNSVFMKIGSKLALEAIVMVRIAIPRNQLQDPTTFKRFFFVGFVVGCIEICAILLIKSMVCGGETVRRMIILSCCLYIKFSFTEKLYHKKYHTKLQKCTFQRSARLVRSAALRVTQLRCIL
jgi:hypothetical protein